jgi:arylsulfatase A-like enzyme
MDFASQYMHHGRVGEGADTAEEKAFDAWLTELNRDRGSVSMEATPFPVECQLPYRIVRDAMGFVDGVAAANGGGTNGGAADRGARSARGGRPFFLWMSFPEPHNPYQAPEPYFSLFPDAELPERVGGPELLAGKTGPLGEKLRWEREMLQNAHPGYDDKWRRYRANYCGMLRLLDDQLRRFSEHLERKGLLENTIFLFTADHGDYAGDYGLQRKGVGLPECLIRIPYVWWGPGIEAREANAEDHVSLVDVMPTVCEAVGMGDQVPYGVQGRSLWPALTGGEYPKEEFRSAYVELGYGGLHYGEEERPELHFEYGGRRFDELNTVTQSGTVKGVRMGRWKLTYDMLGNGELYDLEADPAELRNVYGEPGMAGVRVQLLEELLRWTIRAEDDLPVGQYVPKRAARGWYAAGG